MTKDEFEALLTAHIVPMFPGSRLKDAQPDELAVIAFASLADKNAIIIRWPPEGELVFKLYRAQDFEPDDAALVDEAIKNLHSAAGSPFFDDLINPAIRQTVAAKAAPRCTPLVAAILRQLERWSEETYEGRPIAAALGVDSKAKSDGSVNILDVFKKKFGVVVANGLESFLTVARGGELLGYEPFPDIVETNGIFAPLRFARLAEWTNQRDGRVGLALTRNGEVLVMKDGLMIFAKRRGVWRHFPHRALARRAQLKGSFEKSLMIAVHETCLDVSFARTGGGIGIVLEDEAERFEQSNVLNHGDRVGSDEIKGEFLAAIIGDKKFQDLDRRLRQDLVAIDGAMILGHDGSIHAAGAIVNVNGGGDGGGRLAAAHTLSAYGLGIKISSDGEISGFRTSTEGRTLWFSFG